MGTRCAAAAQCCEHVAVIEAQRVQIKAQRHGMAKMAGDLKAVQRELDATQANLGAFKAEAEARDGENMCKIASL